MTRVEVVRPVAADPASVALLMSELPTATDPERTWVVGSPRRTGATFTAPAQTSGLAEFSAAGELTIDPAVDGDGGCDLRLSVEVPLDRVSGRVERSAARFLATVAFRARVRSLAA
jgi:hypothetical protein